LLQTKDAHLDNDFISPGQEIGSQQENKHPVGKGGGGGIHPKGRGLKLLKSAKNPDRSKGEKPSVFPEEGGMSTWSPTEVAKRAYLTGGWGATSET